MATQPDYSFKPTFSGDTIIAGLQKKAALEQQAKIEQEQLKIQKEQHWMSIAKEAGNAVSHVVEAVKAKQKKDFINTLADSLASQSFTPTGQANTFASQRPEGGVGPANRLGQAVPTASYDPNKADMLRSAVQIDPESFTKQIAENAFPNQQTLQPRQKNLSNYVDGQGNLVRVVTDTITGKNIAVTGQYAGQEIPQEYMETLQPGYAPKTITDPETQEILRLASSGATSAITGPSGKRKKGDPITEFNQLNPLQRKYVDKEVASSQADGVVTRINERIAKFNEAEAILETNNWVTDATLGALLARTIASEVGNLNETEQQRYNVTPEVWRGIKTRASRWSKGTRTAEDREDIQTALTVLKQKAEDNRERRLDLYVNRLSNKIPDIDKQTFKDKFFRQDVSEPKGGLDFSAMSTEDLINQLADEE